MKHIFLTTAIVLSLTACRDETAAAKPYEENHKALERKCENLTKNDTKGRVYMSIAGRYMASKSYSTYVSGNPSTTIHKLALESNTGENVVVIGSIGKHFNSVLISIVGEKTLKKQKDTEEIYGICAFKNENGLKVGSLETFMKLGTMRSSAVK